MGVGFELIEHTADVGIRLWADDLEGLFFRAARALFSLLVISKKEVISTIPVNIEINGVSHEDLLVKWLAELLYYFETRHLVLTNFWIDELTESRLIGGAKGVKFDNLIHKFDHQIKGISYHNLEIKKTDRGLESVIIFDI